MPCRGSPGRCALMRSKKPDTSASGFFFLVRSECCMAWSISDISTLKMSFFWNDSAEDVAFILRKDVAEVQAKARELGIHLQTLRSYVPSASASSVEGTRA